MRPDVVVEEAELAKRAVERIQRVDSELVELALERAEEALDAPILPRAARIGSLMADTEKGECEAERPGSEDGFIVGSHGAGLAVASDGFDQFGNQRPARFGRQRF